MMLSTQIYGKRRLAFSAFPLLLLLFFVTSCEKKEEPAPEKNDVYGSWILQYIEVQQEGGQKTRIEGQNIRLNLSDASAHGQDNEPTLYDLHGTLPVNLCNGRYEIMGSPVVPTQNPQEFVLEIGPISSTKASGSEEQMQLEYLYLQSLEKVFFSSLAKDGKLELRSRYQNARLFFLPLERCSRKE